MKQPILILLLLVSFLAMCSKREEVKAVLSPEPKIHAWWLRITFIPSENEIYGIPIKDIDSKWLVASPLRKEAIPHEAVFKNEQGQVTMARNYIDFVQKGDFNNDGIEDLALVGVFQDRNNKQGNFLLILSKNKNGFWEKTYLQSWTGKPGFLGLQGDGHHLVLWFCMRCGGFSDVTWNEKLKTYQIEDSAD